MNSVYFLVSKCSYEVLDSRKFANQIRCKGSRSPSRLQLEQLTFVFPQVTCLYSFSMLPSLFFSILSVFQQSIKPPQFSMEREN